MCTTGLNAYLDYQPVDAQNKWLIVIIVDLKIHAQHVLCHNKGVNASLCFWGLSDFREACFTRRFTNKFQFDTYWDFSQLFPPALSSTQSLRRVKTKSFIRKKRHSVSQSSHLRGQISILGACCLRRAPWNMDQREVGKLRWKQDVKSILRRQCRPFVWEAAKSDYTLPCRPSWDVCCVQDLCWMRWRSQSANTSIATSAGSIWEGESWSYLMRRQLNRYRSGSVLRWKVPWKLLDLVEAKATNIIVFIIPLLLLSKNLVGERELTQSQWLKWMLLPRKPSVSWTKFLVKSPGYFINPACSAITLPLVCVHIHQCKSDIFG